jgi:single-strand DNA-binding protein
MGSYCRITIIGHLGGDPELKSFGDNTVCNFSVAVSRFKKRGEDEQPPVWYRVAAWNKTAEACERYLNKGSQVYVEGELNPREYESGGETRTSLDVRASVVQFLGGKSDGGGGQERAPRETYDHTKGGDDSEIPF